MSHLITCQSLYEGLPPPSTLFLWIYSSKTSISPCLSYIISFSFLYWNLTRLSIVAFHEDENFLHALSLSLSLTLRHTQHPQFISPTPPPTRAKHRGSLWWETETICWFGAYGLHSKAIDGKTERKEDAKRPKWQREKGKQRDELHQDKRQSLQKVVWSVRASTEHRPNVGKDKEKEKK